MPGFLVDTNVILDIVTRDDEWLDWSAFALERALDAAVFMIFSNNGERCTAGSRILVQQSIYADFVQRFTERAKRIAVGDPAHPMQKASSSRPITRDLRTVPSRSARAVAPD